MKQQSFKTILGIWFSLLCFLSAATSWAELPATVNVKLLEAHPEISTVVLQGPFRSIYPVSRQFGHQPYQISNQNGQVSIRPISSQHKVLQASRIVLTGGPDASVTLKANTLEVRKYPGQLTILPVSGGRLQFINRLPTRQYIALVVASETLTGWPIEALKAQAVLTQTRLSRYQPGDTLGDSTQQEAYLGSTHQRTEADRAVKAVWGETLTYQGQTITPFYHASCAGHTSGGRYLNPQNNLPWLTDVTCPYCNSAPFFKPTQTTIPKAAFEKTFGHGLPQIKQQDAAERPTRIQLATGQSMSGYAFWLKLGQRFGWGKAPGTRFSIHKLSTDDYAIQSTGAGHGVGLCQWGAAGMARSGKNYRDILRFYFPKAQLTGHQAQ